MAKRHELTEHTADVGVLARADSLGELYEALAEGLADVIYDRSEVAGRVQRVVEVEAEDREALAVDFLSRLLTVVLADYFLYAAVRVEMDGELRIRATLEGEAIDVARHEIRTEVKAITYHQLEVAPRDGRWVGRVILDL